MNQESSSLSTIRTLGRRVRRHALLAAAFLPALVGSPVHAQDSSPSSIRGSLQVEKALLNAIHAGDFEQAWDMTGPFASMEVVSVVNRLMDHVEHRPAFAPEPPIACFSKEAPPKPEVIEAVNRAMLQYLDPGYNLGTRWSGSNNTPRALTWSFVPDGLSIPSGVGEPVAGSNLFSSMDSRFASQGGRATWIAQFQACFDRWAALTGLSYTRITVGGNDWDDGATWGNSGAAGLRGDVRISGKNIDGVNGVLAYNSFPPGGDMVIDTSENWGSSSNTYRFLRNTLMHEHGHGIGLFHVCPSNGSKLMEPFLNTGFDGPRHDDLRAGQVFYGDNYEPNNSAATATDLGTLAANATLTPSTVPGASITSGSLCAISINGDLDYYRFTTTGSILLSVNAAPVGLTYDSSSQNGDGSCGSGNNINSLAMADLVITVYASDGTTVLATANATAAGAAETISNLSLATIGNYYVRISENNSPTQSQLYSLSITATSAGCTSPSISTQPSSASACTGTNAAFSVLAAGSTPTFQWRRGTTNLVNGGSISGATTSDLVITGVVAGDAASDYNCVITNACGTVTSNNAALTVNIPAAYTSHPASTSACEGGIASFSVTATGSPAPTYQWRRGFTPLVDGGSISGATSPTLTITGVVADDGGTYTCVISNPCGNLTSNFASLGVTTAPAISSQPSPLTRCTGTSASFTVGFSGTPTPTLQWRKDSVNIPGATSSTLSIPSVSLSDAGTYDCVVTNSCDSVTTNPVALTVNSAPAITTNPTNASACPGSPASFSVAVSGTPAPTFQWRKDGSNIPGANATSFSIAAVSAADLGSYDCVVTNTCGSDTSTAASLSLESGPSIATQPANATVNAGSSAVFSVAATGSPTLSFQWRKDTANLSNGGFISGADTNTLSINPAAAADAGSYDCVISNSCGSITSDAATLAVNSGCIADVDDGSGTGTPDGGVTIDDLLYYLFIFEAGDIRSDVDDGSGTGTPDGGVTIDDLLYYLLRFESGC